MMPDVGMGSTVPLSSLWWLTAIVLFIFTLLAGSIVGLVNRFLRTRETSERDRDERLGELSEAIREQELKILERDAEHQAQIHELELKIIQCRQEQCAIQGSYVRAEDHHGDMLRVQDLIEGKHKEVMAAIVGLHKRVDTAFGPSVT